MVALCVDTTDEAERCRIRGDEPSTAPRYQYVIVQDEHEAANVRGNWAMLKLRRQRPYGGGWMRLLRFEPSIAERVGMAR